MPLPLGKLSAEFLQKNLDYLKSHTSDPSVIIGPLIGQDNAVIDIGDKFLVVKSDPVTFTTENIGYYAVSINANDVVLSGAEPQWFSCVILLPKETTEEVISNIFHTIALECKKWGISVIGGHTEITSEITRPIVCGTMFGMVAKDKLITTMGGKPGDSLLLTQGIAIEGISIICTEKESDLLSKGLNPSIIQQGKDRLFNPGICIVREARLLTNNFNIHAMHDPTEGGLAMGAVELADNSKCGLKIYLDKIPLLPPTKQICEIFELDPLSLISSGCILCAVDPKNEDEIIHFMSQHKVPIRKIGELTAKAHTYDLVLPNGNLQPLKFSTKDEITKIF